MTSVPYRGAMVGREHQLSRIVNFTLDLEREECSGIIFLWAPPGIGKTRLVIEVDKSIPQRDFVFIEGNHAAGSAPFSDFLQSWFNLDPGAAPEDNLDTFNSIWEGLLLNLEIGFEKKSRKINMELEASRPYFEYLLGLCLDENSIVYQLEPAQRAAKTSQALVTFIDVLSLLDPLVVVLENIQWFSWDDKVTAKRIAESTSGSPRVLIVTGRPDEHGNRPEFPEIALYVRADTIFLDGLPESSISSFVKEFGIGSPEEKLVEFLWDRAGGVPLFLEQMIDYLNETNSIRNSSDELRLETSAEEIPVTIRDMFISRMLFMPDSFRNVAMAASVLGGSFRKSDIEAMLEVESVDSDLNAGVEKRIFSMEGSSGSFSHILFHDWIIEMSPAAELQRFHIKAGEIFEKESESYPLPSRLEKISEHYLSGGNTEKAVCFMEQAAVMYADNFDNRAATGLYRKLIPMLDEPRKTRAELQLSEVYRNLGLLNEGTELLSCTLDRLHEYSSVDRYLEALVMLKLSTHMGLSGKLKEAEEMLRESLKVFEADDDIENQAIAVKQLGMIVRSAGRMDEAVVLVEKSIELARETCNPSLICESLYWAAITYRQTGDYRKMKECTEEQVMLAKETGSIRNTISGYDNLMRVHIYNRDYVDAEKVYEKLISLAEKTDNWAALSTATSKLGIIHLRRGEWESATECFKKCVDLTEKTGNHRAKCAALGNLAHASISMEDTVSGLKYSTELIDTASSIGFRTGLMSGYARMGYIFSLRGDYESALECIQTQIEHAETLRDVRNLSDGWATISDIQFKLNEIPDSIASIDKALEFSFKADDMLLYSSQLTQKGRILFMDGRKQEAEDFLNRALALMEGRKEREKLVFRCRLYLKAIRAETNPGLSDEILEITKEAPDNHLKGEAYYCHWKLTGSRRSAAEAAGLLTAKKSSFPQPVSRRMLDDIKNSCSCL